MRECEHHNNCMHYKLPSVHRRTTTRRQRRAERPTHYESEVSAILPMPRSMPDLVPGESATIKTPVRAQSVESDWLVPVLQALTTGGFAALLSVTPTVLIKLPWYSPLVVWSTGTAVAWFLTSKEARSLLMLVEEFTGTDLDGDGEIGDININTTIQEDGGTKHNTITVPMGMARAWRKFCQTVSKGECNFSGVAAKAKGVDPVVFKRIVSAWVSSDPNLALINPKTVGPRKTMELTPRGESVVESHSTLPLPQLVGILGEATGIDR